VSACRSFTYRTFRDLGERLDFPHQRSDFDRLVAFSFISPTTGGAGQRGQAYERGYAMHQLLRRALGTARPDSIRRAHQVLEERYRQIADGGDFVARLEQMYHAAQLDAAGVVAEWAALMDQGLAAGRYDRCRAMITLLGDLPVEEADRSRLTYRVARADIGLGRWAEAEALLDALPGGSAHATLLRAELAEAAGEHYGLQICAETKLRAGTIYPILARLERVGWVRSSWEDPAAHVAEGRPRRRYYKLTDEGAERARDALKRAERSRIKLRAGALRSGAPGVSW
jgi:PadR family transcriptional regulator, regulatory protein PadR